MNWKAFIADIELPNLQTTFRFNLSATNNQLKALQDYFNLNELPEELAGLYKESNGIEQYLDTMKIGELIWPIDKVIKTNKELRNNPNFKDLYMSFEQLLFVADAGNGDLFGFVTLNGNFDRNDIFVWNHENDSREWVAPNLTKFIE